MSLQIVSMSWAVLAISAALLGLVRQSELTSQGHLKNSVAVPRSCAHPSATWATTGGSIRKTLGSSCPHSDNDIGRGKGDKRPVAFFTVLGSWECPAGDTTNPMYAAICKTQHLTPTFGTD